MYSRKNGQGVEEHTLKENVCGVFPDGPVVKAPHSTAGSMGSIPEQGGKISHAVWHSQKKKKVTSGDKVMEKLEPLCTVDDNVK